MNRILALGLSALSICLDYRFLSRTLGRKYSPWATVSLMLVLEVAYGQVNLYFGIAGTVLGNTAYAFAGMLLIHRWFFSGSNMKVAFFTLMIQEAPAMMTYILFPAILAFEGNLPLQLATLSGISYVTVLIKGILLEYAGRKLQSLRYDFPAGYAFYLLVTAFVSTAVCLVAELSLRVGDGSAYAYLFGGIFAALGMLVLVLAVIIIDRQLTARLNEQQALLQSAHYKIRQEEWRNTSRLFHDVKNHFLCLEALLREGKTDKALLYVHTLTHAVESLQQRVYTGNDFVDAILNDKRSAALSQDIAFSADMALPAECGISPPDLCCIFSNIFDNAINACKRVQGKRWIEARAYVRQGQLLIEVKNSCRDDGGSRLAGGAASFAKFIYGSGGSFGHGYGLGNVRSTLEKYGGTMELSMQGCFVFSAMLPLGSAVP